MIYFENPDLICGIVVYLIGVSGCVFDTMRILIWLWRDLMISDAHNMWIWFLAGDTMRQRIKFTDERVCKSHLLESCPHDILSGTVSVSLSFLIIIIIGVDFTHLKPLW